MPDETAYERSYETPTPAFSGPRPAMAAHWPAPPGGWQPEHVAGPLLADGGASTKSDLGTPVAPPVDAADDADWAGRYGGSWSDSDGSPGPEASSKSAFPNGAAPPGGPPIGSAVPARSRPKHLPVILSAIAGLMVIGLLTGVAFATVAAVHRYRQGQKLAMVGMDQPVRDGNFQFTADNMQCGIDEIGPPDDYQSPTGQFCVVTLTIKNVGADPAIFADAIQKAYGPNGVWFGSDSEAAFYANPDPNIFFNDVNPGNKIKALVVYDIPPSEHILRLEVHENPSTRGAIIKIG